MVLSVDVPDELAMADPGISVIALVVLIASVKYIGATAGEIKATLTRG